MFPSPISSSAPCYTSPSSNTRNSFRHLNASDISERQLNSALRIVYFAHPRQNHIDESKGKIDNARLSKQPLSDQNKKALQNLIAGPLGIGRQDNKTLVEDRSPRLTSGQIAADMIDHIDSVLAKKTTLRAQGEHHHYAIAVQDVPLTADEYAELVKYKDILFLFNKTTGYDFSLSQPDIEKCLSANDFCVIHDNFPKDAHSQAILLARNPLQVVMCLNQLGEEKRPVEESPDLVLVGGNKLQWNKLYSVASAHQFEKLLMKIVANYNASQPLFSTEEITSSRAELWDELKHGNNPLVNRQFTRPPIGYGCEFKTVSDMEEVILSSDLRTKIQQHLQALACLAMKTKNLSPDQPIPEEKIWETKDFPKKR